MSAAPRSANNSFANMKAKHNYLTINILYTGNSCYQQHVWNQNKGSITGSFETPACHSQEGEVFVSITGVWLSYKDLPQTPFYSHFQVRQEAWPHFAQPECGQVIPEESYSEGFQDRPIYWAYMNIIFFLLDIWKLFWQLLYTGCEFYVSHLDKHIAMAHHNLYWEFCLMALTMGKKVVVNTVHFWNFHIYIQMSFST